MIAFLYGLLVGAGAMRLFLWLRERSMTLQRLRDIPSRIMPSPMPLIGSGKDSKFPGPVQDGRLTPSTRFITHLKNSMSWTLAINH